MEKQFEIGDNVAVLDEAIKGTVTHINGNQISIEDENGFPLEFEERQLVRIDGAIEVSNFEAAKVKKQKEGQKPKKSSMPRTKERAAPKMEVDLHIHQLVNSNKGLNNYDMLEIQLKTAKQQLEFAMRKRIQKVVFIHGVGEGVLKEELHYLFKRYDNLKFYDADYAKYGLGATEVYIFQNPSSK